MIDISKMNGGQIKSPSQQKVDTAAPHVVKSSEPSAKAAPTVAKDSVSLTPQAQSLGKMQRSMASEAPFNKDRVNDIKKAIAEGQYKVDPEKLAQKMQDFEQDLGNITS